MRSVLFFAFLLSGCGSGLCLTAANCQPNSSTVYVLTDLLPSLMHRSSSTTQISLTTELALGVESVPAGYHPLPSILLDDDGLNGSNLTLATRPSVSCGTTQTTVTQRITDCLQQNPTTATWDGATKGNGAQGTWKLVTFDGTYEVWRDERTLLLWSDTLGAATWCKASGNSGGGPSPEADPSAFCTNVLYQDQTTPESWCFEASGLNTPAAYDAQKGAMKATATGTSPSVIWRLPTRWDFHQADLDGIRYVLPNMSVHFWSATVRSDTVNNAWVLSSTNGMAGFNRSSTAAEVRCVGR